MSMIFPSPITTGIGGPLAALFTGLSGYSKTLPWFYLCPVYCLVAAPLIMLFPIILPLYLLHVLAARYRLSYTKKGAFENVLNQGEQYASSSRGAVGAGDDNARTVGGAGTARAAGGGGVASAARADSAELSDEDKEAQRIAARSKKIEDESKNELEALERDHEFVATALARYNTGAFISSHMKTLVLSLLTYYVVFFTTFVTAGFAISNAMMIYVNKAKTSHQLQIATAEQLDYANAVNNIITIAGIVIFVTIMLIFAVVFVSAIKGVTASAAKSEAQQAQAEGRAQAAEEIAAQGAAIEKVGTLRTALASLLKNLPGLAVLMCILYAIFVVVERYYAHMRITAVEAMVLGQPYFDPGLPFIAIRFYVIYAFCLAFASVILMSLHALPMQHRKAKAQLKY